MKKDKNISDLIHSAKDKYEAMYWDFVYQRGVDIPCEQCNGLGTKVYSSTATWQGGIGGAAMTTDVCDKCWGSGDKYRHWVNLRKLENK
jgi:hypothetical protein